MFIDFTQYLVDYSLSPILLDIINFVGNVFIYTVTVFVARKFIRKIM